VFYDFQASEYVPLGIRQRLAVFQTDQFGDLSLVLLDEHSVVGEQTHSLGYGGVAPSFECLAGVGHDAIEFFRGSLRYVLNVFACRRLLNFDPLLNVHIFEFAICLILDFCSLIFDRNFMRRN